MINEDLINREELFRQTFEYATIGISLTSTEGRFLNVNKALFKMLGYTKEELLSMGFNDITYPDDLNKSSASLQSLAAGEEENCRFEKRYIRKDGNLVWADISISFYKDSTGAPLYFITHIIDITDRKQSEEALNKTLKNLEEAERISHLGHYEIDAATGKTVWSEEIFRIFGLDSKGYPPNVETYKDLIHPEDVSLVFNLFEATVTEGIPFNLVYRIIRDDGEIRLVHSIAETVKDKQNKVVKIFGTFQDITEQKRLHSIVKASEQRFRALIENSSDAIALVDKDGKILYDAPSYNRILGFTAEELMGRNSLELVHPEDREYMIERLNLLSQTPGKTIELQARELHKEGTWRWLEGTATNLLDEPSVGAIVINFRDITERKFNEEKIRKLSRGIEQSPAAIIITDINGNIEYVNPKFTEVTGYTFEEVREKNPRFLKSGYKTREEYSELWQTILSGKEWRGEILNKKKNGELYWELTLISPILNEQGRITNFIALKEDITERKKMTNELIKAKEKAEEMNRVKSFFYANMSHELRTPFVGIMGYAEILSESLRDPEEKQMAEVIMNSSGRLMETLNKILNITKLEFEKVEINLNPVSVFNLIQDLVLLYSKAAGQKNTIIKTAFKCESCLLTTDEILLREILSGLINNAVKYTSNGVIEISTDIIMLGGKDFFSIKVSDSGVGIPKEKQEIIWDEFRQASEGIGRSFEGAGLGLSLAKKYSELLNGNIFVESENGKGSVFTLELPLPGLKKEATPGNKMLRVDRSSFNKNVGDRKILLVEDDPIAKDFIRRTVSAKYKLDTASSASAALKMLLKNGYSLFLIDINLNNGVDGIELTQKIREYKGYENIPVVAVTAYASVNDEKEFLSKGFTHYISKPFSSKDLKSLLYKIFNQ